MAASIDDLEAINVYMRKQVPQTSAATSMKRDFISWYDDLGFWDKNVNTQITYDKARSKRNAFNLENAVTEEAKAQVVNVLSTGLTTEQMQGQSRPVVNTSTGAVGTQVTKDKKSMTPTTSGGKTLTRVLSLGTYGDDVATWQTRMGISPPTKYFGATTVEKTKAFQRAAGFTGTDVDGKVGSKTWGTAFPNLVEAPRTASSSYGPQPAIVQETGKPPVVFADKPIVSKPIAVPVTAKPVAKPPIASAPSKPKPKTEVKQTQFREAPKKEPPKRIDVKPKMTLATMVDWKSPITWVTSALIAVAAFFVAVPPKKKI